MPTKSKPKMGRAAIDAPDTKSAAVAKTLTAKRQKLVDVQQAHDTLRAEYHAAERALGVAAANDRTAEIERREDALTTLATRQRRALLTIDALKTEIVALERDLADAEAQEQADEVQKFITRCERAAAKADECFNGPARLAVTEFVNAADELFALAQHPGGNRPSDMTGRAIAALFMAEAPNQFRAIAHTPGSGSHADQTGFPNCFGWWARRLAVRAARPKGTVVAIERTGTED